jgi:transcriptional regulator with XRE-family HTH domain
MFLPPRRPRRRFPSNSLLSSVVMTVGTVSDVVAAKVKDARKRRLWRVGDLAERCATLSVNSIENIESGRRQGGKRTRAVTVDELYDLARALDMPPVEFLPGTAAYGPMTASGLRKYAAQILRDALDDLVRKLQEETGRS